MYRKENIILRYQNKVHRIPLYYVDSYYRKNTKLHKGHSSSVLKFKTRPSKHLLRYFTNEVIKMINHYNLKFDIIVQIPSSTLRSVSYGSRYICGKVSETFGVENGSYNLTRIQGITPSHLLPSSQRNSEHKHYETIYCNDKFSNKKVLLFDDILTKGDTARACIRKLYEQNASDISLVVLGRTQYVP